MALWIKAEDGNYINVGEAKTLSAIGQNMFRAPCQVVATMGTIQVVICTLPSREEAERVLRRIAADLGAKSYQDYLQIEPRQDER